MIVWLIHVLNNIDVVLVDVYAALLIVGFAAFFSFVALICSIGIAIIAVSVFRLALVTFSSELQHLASLLVYAFE